MEVFVENSWNYLIISQLAMFDCWISTSNTFNDHHFLPGKWQFLGQLAFLSYTDLRNGADDMLFVFLFNCCAYKFSVF